MSDHTISVIRDCITRDEPAFTLDPAVAIRGGRRRQRTRRATTALCLAAVLGITIVVGGGDAHAAAPESRRAVLSGAP